MKKASERRKETLDELEGMFCLSNLKRNLSDLIEEKIEYAVKHCEFYVDVNIHDVLGAKACSGIKKALPQDGVACVLRQIIVDYRAAGYYVQETGEAKYQDDVMNGFGKPEFENPVLYGFRISWEK